jgi:hypothetical protein
MPTRISWRLGLSMKRSLGWVQFWAGMPACEEQVLLYCAVLYSAQSCMHARLGGVSLEEQPSEIESHMVSHSVRQASSPRRRAARACC